MSNVAKTKNFELLAPGGDIESIKAAIAAGADAIYCGLDSFNARNRATNLTFDVLSGIIRLAHQNNCKIFLTLNIVVLDSEIPAVIRLLNKLVNTKVDGVILQDLGLFHIIKEYFPTLDVHASTQINTHNDGQILFLKQLQASRVNLSRELNIREIKHLAQFGHQHDVLMEVFVHGSYCIGFSGLCYISSVKNGNSGNRGRCSQPCRDQYQTTAAGKDFPLNMKDNSAFSNMVELADAGVYSLKVEGRIKKSHYVYTVVDQWRQQIDRYCEQKPLLTDTTSLFTVFNRDFSNSYLQGDINKSMFIDNPRDNSVSHFTQVYQATTIDAVNGVKQKLYDDKTAIINTVEDVTKAMDVSSLPMTMIFSGKEGQCLTVIVTTPDQTIELQSESALIGAQKHVLTHELLEKRFQSLANEGEYQITHVDISGLAENTSVPFTELAQLKEQIGYQLNGEKALVAPIDTPKPRNSINHRKPTGITPELAILISDPSDVVLNQDNNAVLYYTIPEGLAMELEKTVALFEAHPHLVPWFPAILIGENYQAAVAFIERVKPNCIVTNNSGIAHVAYQQGIDWIAGPYLNLTNSFSLQCIADEFNAKGAFVSNEINRKQINPMVCPENFELHYSIYHPLMMLMSRQCLFHQTVGCKKKHFDNKCLRKCDKSASILSLKDASFVLDKQRGAHNALYSQQNYMNLQAVTDFPDKFTRFMIDLRDIKTETEVNADKAMLVSLFNAYIHGDINARATLEQTIIGTISQQYKKGL
ncbi:MULTISPECIES: peptidase U32 family protein [unclassified Photobacterium]|uniref:peptidase U32 family protein n=1 Tax=unclassified Photobacterium TaxID=2628852 RepID=UPI000D17B79D|nr:MULTISPECIES: peptidase U32 family protein [unclassified Photobacterium]PSV28215.1 collagenase-like protease [Photobacterium sp. GB-56]PSV32481.1 collagenase-like protease [Photobacterium sp. GB-72]PSV54610.1 collagenase-like protease [Photobacterium sp. GB-1]PSV58354.1 collagenase-like protease [Photobacterium sp. GB-3]